MLINTTVTIALFCVSCGKVHREELSYFVLGNSGIMDINCGCGHNIGVLKGLSQGRYRLFFYCEICKDVHSIELSRRGFAQEDALRLFAACQQTEIGVVGNSGAVQQELFDRSNELCAYLKDNLSEEDCNEPHILFEAINRIDDLAENGSICCGECGSNNIGLEVLDRHILLFCSGCGNMYALRAMDESDAKKIRELSFIELQPAK